MATVKVLKPIITPGSTAKVNFYLSVLTLINLLMALAAVFPNRHAMVWREVKLLDRAWSELRSSRSPSD